MNKKLLNPIISILLIAFINIRTHGQEKQTPPNDSCEYAMQFKDGRETITNLNSFGKSNSFSIAGWFKTDSTDQGLLMIERDCCSDRYTFLDITNSGTLSFRYQTSSSRSSTVRSNSFVNDGEWHHFTAIRNSGLDSLFLYIDGKKEASSFFNRDIFINPDLELVLGYSYYTNNYFLGEMDEISYWSKAISSTEVQSIMQNQLIGNESNLRLYYNFNEEKEIERVIDRSGNNRDGSFTDFSAFSRFLPEGTPCSQNLLFPPNKNCGTVLNFDGVDDHIITNIGANNFLDKDFTMEAWVYLNEYSNSYASLIMSNRTENEGARFYIGGETHGNGKGLLYFDPVEGFPLAGTTFLETKKWYHVAAVYDFKSGNNNNLKLFVNGIEDASYNNAGRIKSFRFDRVPAEELYIGFEERASSPNAYHFDGMIDEVRIWSDQRSSLEIASYMDSSLTSGEDNLIAAFNFNEGNSSSYVHDIVNPVNHEGTLMNMDSTTVWVDETGANTRNTFSEITLQSCSPYTSPSGQQITTSSNLLSETATYIDVIQNNIGCDSTIRINLTLNVTPDSAISLVGNELRANDVKAPFTYEWSNCSKPELGILGSDWTFTPTTSGDYKLSVTNGNCAVESICKSIVVTSIYSSTDWAKQINTYPNPTNGSILIDLKKNYANIKARIKTSSGTDLSTTLVEDTNRIFLNIQGEAGVYFIEVETSKGDLATIKVIKQ